MQKPLFLWPFIFVYRLVFAIIKAPYNFIKYFSFGLLYMSELFVNGVIWSSYFVYRTLRYTADGFMICLRPINSNIKTITEKRQNSKVDKLDKKQVKELFDNIPVVEENIEKNNEIENQTIDEIVDNEPLSIENIKDENIETTAEPIKELETISEKQNEEVIVEPIINEQINIDELKQNVNDLQNVVEKLRENSDIEIEQEDDLSIWKDAFESPKEIEDKGLRIGDVYGKVDSKENGLDSLEELNNAISDLDNIDYSKVKITERELKKLTKTKLLIQKKIRKEKEKQAKQEIIEEKNRLKEEKRLLKIERKQNLAKKANDSYVNEKVDIKKPSVFDNLSKKINEIPKIVANKFKNNDFVKHSRNQRMMKREALLINFEGEDAKKSEVKIPFQYEAKDKEGKYVKGFFEAFSKVEVHSYLLSEGYEVYSIKTNKWIQAIYKRDSVNHVKIKTKDLIFFLTQLSTYLKAGIPLVDSLRILARQFKQKQYKRIFEEVIYDLTTGENFSEALLKQNVAFPRLLINMVKTAEMTGELPEVLDDMANYYTQTENTRKQMVTALMYPSLVFIFSVAVITFMMIFVIPQFVEIYEAMDATEIPKFTLIVISVSEFLQTNILWVVIGVIIFFVLFAYAYNNIKGFKRVCQWIFMHIPIMGNTIIYNEVTMFTKTFASLLSHNVFITDSMEVLNKITNNEIYKMLILDTIANLAVGEKISKSFENHWAFPAPAYEMLVTGEKTGELAEMMQKVSDYYQRLHAEQVTRIKTFIEPILTIFLTVVVGIIILAVIIPMFSMYETIQSY